jgi:hypothetical protein
MKTLMREASGHMRFSWKSEQAISHFLQPLHFERSRAIHISRFSSGAKPLQLSPKHETLILALGKFKFDAIKANPMKNL